MSVNECIEMSHPPPAPAPSDCDLLGVCEQQVTALLQAAPASFCWRSALLLQPVDAALHPTLAQPGVHGLQPQASHACHRQLLVIAGHHVAHAGHHHGEGEAGDALAVLGCC